MATYICPYCFSKNTKTKTRQCPKCGYELPRVFGNYKDETFSIIGLKESGKSHFMGMVLRIFSSTGLSDAFNMSTEIALDHTGEKYRKMYSDQIAIRETVAAEDNQDNIREPLIYKLVFRKRRMFGTPKLDVATMSLFDNAGEDLFKESTMRKVNQCVFNSTGIILIIDPLQLPSIREQLKVRGISLPIDHARGKDGGTKEILTRVAKLIRENQNLREDHLIEIPLAIAFSKSDVLRDIIGEGNSMIFQPSGHNGVINKRELMGISNEIESFITSWDDTGIVTQIKNNFKTYCFFGFSALGANIEGGTTNKGLRPFRVEDPLLWLMHKRGLIKMK